MNKSGLEELKTLYKACQQVSSSQDERIIDMRESLLEDIEEMAWKRGLSLEDLAEKPTAFQQAHGQIRRQIRLAKERMKRTDVYKTYLLAVRLIKVAKIAAELKTARRNMKQQDMAEAA